MTRTKRAIIVFLICLEPFSFAVICISYSLIQFFLIYIHKSRIKGFAYLWLFLITSLLLMVTYLARILRYRIDYELEPLMLRFQSSRRGLRVLGVVLFHLLFICGVIALVYPINPEPALYSNRPHFRHQNRVRLYGAKPSRIIDQFNGFKVARARYRTFSRNDIVGFNINKHGSFDEKLLKRLQANNVLYLRSNSTGAAKIEGRSRSLSSSSSSLDQEHLDHLLACKSIIVACVYSVMYFILERITELMYDSSVIDAIHELFVKLVLVLFGFDLGDYVGGEMHFNLLMERRIR